MQRRWLSILGAVLLVPLMALALIGAAGVLDYRPSWLPFTEETIDRTGPSVLESLTEISEFHAASGYYETVVDIEKDTRFVPGWISGERVLYVGKGTVHGVVDFSDLGEDNVTVSDDGTMAAITLPTPTVGTPVLDLENSYVVSHDQGIVNRFRGSELEREAQLKAVEQMEIAAAGEGMLLDVAKENTASMLRGLLGALGFNQISVSFE